MSILINLVKDLFRRPASLEKRNLNHDTFQYANTLDTSTQEKKVLNVGGNSKAIGLPEIYHNWTQILLDIDPRGKPDLVCDARELDSLDRAQFQAVYCSHNLEHYYQHDVSKVLRGFQHVLKEDGFVHLRVPDIAEIMRITIERNLDINDFLYDSPAGPITIHDVIYGYGLEIERSGNDFFAHKTGFTSQSLTHTLKKAGFPFIYSTCGNLEIQAFAFVKPPSIYARKLLNLPE